MQAIGARSLSAEEPSVAVTYNVNVSNDPGNRDHQNREIDFGRTAADYERYRPGFPEGFFDRLSDLRWILPRQRVLDLGTGTGSLAIGFAARGLEATGLDIAPELLEVARQAAIDQGLNVNFVKGKAEHTDQDASSYDLVSAGQCWWWFDSDGAIREANRVLAPRGRLLIASFSYLPLPGTVAERTEDLILEHNPGWPMAGWCGVHPEHVQALDNGSFRNVESFSYVIDMPFSHVAWRGRVRTCNGVGSALSAERVEVFDSELADVLAREFPGELNVPHRVFATSGIKT